LKKWLILGATSGIATHLARELGARGYRLCLADRKEVDQKLQLLAQDVHERFKIETTTAHFDAMDMERHEAFIAGIEESFGELDGVVYAVGVMQPQRELEKDFSAARRRHAINYVAAMGLLGSVANRMERRRRGHIVAIGSPAGDRGRKSNYLYGADKAALHVFMEGLRHRLSGKHVTVLTVKPGPTDTPMTAGMKDLKFKARPEDVARDIALAIDRKKQVIYTPAKWRIIMCIIRHLPWCLFRRLDL